MDNKAMRPVPIQCPLCHGDMAVTEVACGSCDIQIRGRFEPGPYDGLAPEQLQFLEAFLRCRGVIRDVEAVLGISYPTVRARLDNLLAALGFAGGVLPAGEHDDEKILRRQEILAAIQAGTMGVEAGLNALQSLQKK